MVEQGHREGLSPSGYFCFTIRLSRTGLGLEAIPGKPRRSVVRRVSTRSRREAGRDHSPGLQTRIRRSWCSSCVPVRRHFLPHQGPSSFRAKRPPVFGPSGAGAAAATNPIQVGAESGQALALDSDRAAPRVRSSRPRPRIVSSAVSLPSASRRWCSRSRIGVFPRYAFVHCGCERVHRHHQLSSMVQSARVATKSRLIR